MKLISRFLLLALTTVGFGSLAQAQNEVSRVKVAEMEAPIQVNLKEAGIPTRSFGQIPAGTMAKSTVQLTNPYSEPLTLHRVTSQRGSVVAGNGFTLREVVIQPGETLEFTVLVVEKEIGPYSTVVKLITSLPNQRRKVSEFKFDGTIVAEDKVNK